MLSNIIVEGNLKWPEHGKVDYMPLYNLQKESIEEEEAIFYDSKQSKIKCMNNNKNISGVKIDGKIIFKEPLNTNGKIIDLKYARKAFDNLNKCGVTILLKDLLDFINDKGK